MAKRFHALFVAALLATIPAASALAQAPNAQAPNAQAPEVKPPDGTEPKVDPTPEPKIAPPEPPIGPKPEPKLVEPPTNLPRPQAGNPRSISTSCSRRSRSRRPRRAPNTSRTASGRSGLPP